MTDMLIIVAIMGGLHETKPFWGALLNSVVGPANLMIIDNAPNSNEGQQEFFSRFITPRWPGQVVYAPQEDNLGVIKSLQFGYENSHEQILAYLHNDLYIYQRGWDRQVVEFFEQHDQVGLVGFFGAEGVHESSGRFFVHNNMLEAEIHQAGRRTTEVCQIAVLDGLSLIANREMLDKRGGVDLSYDVHHFYDLDLSLESIDRGYSNWYLPVACHHQSGHTACRPLFQEWANRYVGVTERVSSSFMTRTLSDSGTSGRPGCRITSVRVGGVNEKDRRD